MSQETASPGEPGATRGTPAKYEAVRAALLAVLPTDGNGLTWNQMVDTIARHVPPGLFAHLGSVRWYTKIVQRDLEAQGLIVRVPNSRPWRLRRVAEPEVDPG